MSQTEKLLMRLLNGSQDKSFSFAELQKAAEALGFTLNRINGDHHIYINERIPEIINLQPSRSGGAKPYQVKQIRDIALKYKLYGGE